MFVSPPVSSEDRLAALAEWNHLFGGASPSFDGASLTKKSMADWNPSGLDADSALAPDLPTLRNRSRDCYRNDPTARASVDTSARKTVGSGLTPRSNIDREFLGLEAERADRWEADYERDWSLHADSRRIDATGKSNFYGLTYLTYLTWAQSGEVFVLLGVDDDDITLRLIEPDRVSTPPHRSEGPRLRNGIELDRRGRPVAIWVRSAHPGDAFDFAGQYRWDRVPMYGPRTGRLNVLHLYKQDRPGQHRGIPFLTPVIEHLRVLSGYGRAELQGALVSSMFTAFLRMQDMGPLHGAGHQKAEEAYLEWAGRLGPGMVGKLPPGADLVFANPQRPNSNYDKFVDSITRGIGAALGIPAEILLKKISSNYTAYRGAVLEAWEFFYAEQTWMIDNFCKPVWAARMDLRVAAGKVTAPGYFQDSGIRHAYLRSQWNGPTMAMVDPVKETQAYVLQAQNGLTTWTYATRALNGSDYTANLRQLERERKTQEQTGFTSPGGFEEPPDKSTTDSEDDDSEPDSSGKSGAKNEEASALAA